MFQLPSKMCFHTPGGRGLKQEDMEMLHNEQNFSCDQILVVNINEEVIMSTAYNEQISRL